MTTMTEIAAEITANLAASMTYIQERTGEIDALLDNLRAAGIELEFRPNNCQINSSLTAKPVATASLKVTKHPGTAGVMREICTRHGTDWYITESGHPLLHMHNYTVCLSFRLPDSFPQDIAP